MYKTVIAPESSVSASLSFLLTTLETLISAIDQALLPQQRLLSSPLGFLDAGKRHCAVSNLKELLCACIKC